MDPIEINGQQYKTNAKLDAFAQFHITRRLAPVLKGYTAAVSGFREQFKGKDLAAVSMLDLVGAMEPLGAALAGLKDEDVNYVLTKCLDQCRRLDSGQWMRLRPPDAPAGMMQYQDIDMPVMLRLTIEVIQENLGGFFPTAPSTSPASTGPQ